MPTRQTTPATKQVAPRGAARLGLNGAKALPKPRPMVEMGVGGTAIFGGYIVGREKDNRVAGRQKWITFADLATNISIVAAGTRYFLNLIAHADWKAEAKDDSAKAKQAAEFVDEVLQDCITAWPRIVRRAAMYRFLGFGIQEWTAKRRPDGKFGFDDIESRPAHTIDRWEVDEHGTILGVWQTSPQTGAGIYLPRGKLIYMVEDSLTDSPEGLGLFRHLVEPVERMRRYLDMESKGFERDLRGIPIGRAPYAAIQAAVKANKITQAKADSMVAALENFVKLQVKDSDTAMMLDSAPYTASTETGETISSTYQWGVELLSGGAMGFTDVANAIDRLMHEMARILGTESLLLGESSGNRALSEDKSRNFYLTADATLNEVAAALENDLLVPLWSLNGFDDDLRPKLSHSDISFRSVAEISATLRDMATAGAVLAPDDPAINQIRDMLSLDHTPEVPPEMQGIPGGGKPQPVAPPKQPAKKPSGQQEEVKPTEGGGGQPVEQVKPATKRDKPKRGEADNPFEGDLGAGRFIETGEGLIIERDGERIN